TSLPRPLAGPLLGAKPFDADRCRAEIRSPRLSLGSRLDKIGLGHEVPLLESVHPLGLVLRLAGGGLGGDALLLGFGQRGGARVAQLTKSLLLRPDLLSERLQ